MPSAANLKARVSVACFRNGSLPPPTLRQMQFFPLFLDDLRNSTGVYERAILGLLLHHSRWCLRLRQRLICAIEAEARTMSNKIGRFEILSEISKSSIGFV